MEKLIAMSVAEIKEKLQNAIEVNNDKQLLEEMLLIITSQTKASKLYSFSDEQLKMLKEREERFVKGESKAITLEEFKTKMNKKHGL